VKDKKIVLTNHAFNRIKGRFGVSDERKVIDVLAEAMEKGNSKERGDEIFVQSGSLLAILTESEDAYVVKTAYNLTDHATRKVREMIPPQAE